jgi:transposase
MARKIEFTKEQKKEIQIAFCKIRKIKDTKSSNRIIVLNMRRIGKTNREISEAIGYNTQYITDIVSLYSRQGMAAIIGNKYTSHNFRMTFAEETEFLEQFRDEAEQGLLTNAKKILEKYEEQTGKKSNISTIYKLLERHGWRKIKPRPNHPNGATEEEKNSSKKLTQNGSKSYWTSI